MPAKSWHRAWKREPWMQRLFGRICDPSIVEDGVDSWIASLAATRASHSASLESSSQRKTPDTSGPPSRISCSSYRVTTPSADPACSSSRTSATICDSEHALSSESFTRWATALRSVCLQRRKSARLISESGCSSWATPNVPNGGRSATHAVMKANSAYTPEGVKVQIGLEHQARHWSTPSAHDGRRPGSDATSTQGATPTSRDWKDGAEPSENVATNSLLGRQAPRITRDGLLSLLPADWISSPLRLNPRFVEWLMGWGIDWTVCDSAETASSPTPPRSLGEPCGTT